MAFQSVPNVAEIVIRMTGNNAPLSITHYARVTTPPYTSSDITALADAVDGWADTYLKQVLSTAYGYVRTDVRGLENENDFSANRSDGAGSGELTGTPLPNNVCLSIKRMSALTGKSARGRVYFPISTTLQLDTNERLVDSVRIGDIVDRLDLLNVAVDIAGWIPVIVSRFNNGVRRSVGVTFDQTAWVAVDRKIDTRRMRQNSD